MMKRKNRKIDRLPAPLKDTVDSMLIDGYTYVEIANFLTSIGHKINKSSVHRYAAPLIDTINDIKKQHLIENITKKQTAEN